jgi:hypothetical protein
VRVLVATRHRVVGVVAVGVEGVEGGLR